MFELKLHTATLGATFNGRTETNGADYQDAVDVEVKDIYLTTEEVDQFEDGLGAFLFNENKQPVLSKFKPLQLSKKIEEATVCLKDGDDDLTISHVKLNGVKLHPLMEGLTKVRVQLQFYPMNSQLDWIRARLRQEIEISISVEQWDAQGSLLKEAA